MSNYTRREILLAGVAGTIYTAFSPISALAADPCMVDHPIMPPRKDLTGQCPNCGMVRPMWARTWVTFENSEGKSQACSFHCLADIALKAGEDPENVQVALYLAPEKMVPAQKAFFVVGSKAKGTMTMKSKIAFPSKAEAEKFSGSCGGEVVGFAQALTVAKAGIAKENPMLIKNRLKKGVIIEPVDDKDHCPVCNMYPARYPNHKCQIITKDKEIYHFCSTQCLFEFLKHSSKYAKKEVVPFRIWVSDFPTGAWISGKTAYYVTGSRQHGPMGLEALAFDKKRTASDFAGKEGGKVLTFTHVTPDDIKPGTK
ncbi:MAG: nitrous oxide reductase accessory protein NosL [Desulfobacteraceae bacterium]|jgi:nitrous oxide reductase accessory protein NosL